MFVCERERIPRDVFPHSVGAEYAAAPTPLRAQFAGEPCDQAHERCGGNLQVRFSLFPLLFVSLEILKMFGKCVFVPEKLFVKYRACLLYLVREVTNLGLRISK